MDVFSLIYSYKEVIAQQVFTPFRYCLVNSFKSLFCKCFKTAKSNFILYLLQYDGIYMLKTGENSSAEPELVLFTSTVNRSISEFLMLEKSLMESNFKGIMKGSHSSHSHHNSFRYDLTAPKVRFYVLLSGINGPSKLLREFNEGKIKNGTFSWRSWLETYLRQVCSKVELCNLPELQEFLAYGQTGNDALVKLDSQPSLHRIEKVGILYPAPAPATTPCCLFLLLTVSYFAAVDQ